MDTNCVATFSEDDYVNVTENSDDDDQRDESFESNPISSKFRKKYARKNRVYSERQLKKLRVSVNSRERERMHDLNKALDGLREVMPYAKGPSVRKLSKMATLLLARNYILMLTKSLEEAKQLVRETNPEKLSTLSTTPPTSPQGPSTSILSPPRSSNLLPQQALSMPHFRYPLTLDKEATSEMGVASTNLTASNSSPIPCLPISSPPHLQSLGMGIHPATNNRNIMATLPHSIPNGAAAMPFCFPPYHLPINCHALHL